VAGVDRIVNIAVGQIQPPPDAGGDGHYLTGVARHQGELIQLIDVESVLAESAPRGSDPGTLTALPPGRGPRRVLLFDDSRVPRHQGELIQLIDVESVLAESAPRGSDLGTLTALPPGRGPRQVLVVDDSRVARNQIRAVLEQLGLESLLLSAGRQALDHLQALVRNGESPAERYAMVI